MSFDQSINPYRGCEHGCIYCFARPTHAYLGMSPGVDFESRLFAKPNAAALLAKELSAPGYVPQGDRHGHQHRSLSAAGKEDAHHPLASWRCCATSAIRSAIVTKSPLILRDIDILSDMAKLGLAKAALSVTTLDRRLARVMEPRAGTPPGGCRPSRAWRCRHSRRRDVRARHSGPERS